LRNHPVVVGKKNMSGHDKHEHAHESHLDNPGGLDVPMVATVAVAGAMLLLVTVLATTAWVKTRAERIRQERTYHKVPYEVGVYRQEQADKISGPVRRNEDGETVAIPIERAMAIYAQQHEKKTSKP
jgi:hypothetical protein